MKTMGFLILMIFSIAVQAQRVCVHGHSGVFQDPARRLEQTRYGWGLVFTAKAEGDWIHYSIPVDATHQYEMIRVRYYREFCPYIADIHIRDGETKIASFKAGKGFFNNPEPEYLELFFDTPRRFWNSIGVSMNIVTTESIPGTRSTRMCSGGRVKIYSVCAFKE